MKILKVGKYNGWSLYDKKGLIVNIPVHADAIRVNDDQFKRLKKYKMEDVTPKPEKKEKPKKTEK